MRIYIGMVSGTLMLWLSVCFPAAGQSGSEIIARTVSSVIDQVLHQPFKALPQSWDVPDEDEETEHELELINPAQSEPSLSPEQRRQLSLWFEFMLDLMLTPGLPALMPVAAHNTCSDKPRSQKNVCLRPAPEDFSSPPATDETENDETEKRNYSEKENSEIFQPPPPAASDTDVEIAESDNPVLSKACYLDNLPNEVLKIILDYLSNWDLLSLSATCRRLRVFIDERYPHDVTLKPLSERGGEMLEFSQDSRYMAMVNENHDVEVFINTGNGLEHKTEITSTQLKKKTVESLTFSPDSRYLIIRTSHHIWCLELTGSNVFSYLSGSTWRQNFNVFSPSGQYLIVDSDTQLYSVFSQCDSGYLFNKHIEITIRAAGFSPDDSCLAISITRALHKLKSDAYLEQELYLYNLPLSNTHAPDFRYSLDPDYYRDIKFTDNDSLVIKELKKILCFQRMDSGWHCVFQYGFQQPIWQAIFLPEVGGIAAIIDNRVGLFWKGWRDGQWDLQQTLQYSYQVGEITFTSQGMSLGVGVGSELHLYTRDFDTNKRQWLWIENSVLTDHFSVINTIAFGSNGQLLTASDDNRLVIHQHWFRNSWLKIGANTLPVRGTVLASPDNSCIAILEESYPIIWLFRVVLKNSLTP